MNGTTDAAARRGLTLDERRARYEAGGIDVSDLTIEDLDVVDAFMDGVVARRPGIAPAVRAAAIAELRRIVETDPERAAEAGEMSLQGVLSELVALPAVEGR